MPTAQIAPAAPTDTVAALAACHERIRTFSAGLRRLAALPDLADPRVPGAAAQAHRYFSQGLPLHAEDEDASVAPRLLRYQPESAPLLDDLAADHGLITESLVTLLPLLERLAAGDLVDPAGLRSATDALVDVLLPHIEREERSFFPLCAALPEAEQQAIGAEIVARRRR